MTQIFKFDKNAYHIRILHPRISLHGHFQLSTSIFGIQPFQADFQLKMAKNSPKRQILQKFSKICNQHHISNPTVYNMTIFGQFQIFGPNGPILGPLGPNLGKWIFFRKTMRSFHEYLSPYRKLLETVEPFWRY